MYPADQPGYYRSESTSPLQTMEQAARGMLEKFIEFRNFANRWAWALWQAGHKDFQIRN